jgi:drug/metabolite transporter (DMT)-like permease
VRPIDFARLVLLAALWGGAFIFLRSVSPVFGAVPTAGTRVLIGGSFLLGWFALTRYPMRWRGFNRHYAVVGTFMCAIPFSLYGFAAQHIPGSYLAIFNASTPLWGAALAAMLLGESLTPVKLVGLAMGVAGVGLVAGRGGADTDSLFAVAVLACLGATLCYAIGSTYVKRWASHTEPRAVAAASQLFGGVLLLPFWFVDPPPSSIEASTFLDLLGLAVLCTAIAHLLYYRLIADVGPSRTLTVSFLIPPFAMLWGKLFLDEAITAAMVAGTLIVIAGTLLVVRSVPSPDERRELAQPVGAIAER